MDQSQRPIRSNVLVVASFVAVTIIGLGAVLFALYFRSVAGVGLHDSNFDVFQSSLSHAQREAIIRTSQGQLSLIVVLLGATNFLWFGCGLFALLRLIRQVPRTRDVA